MIWIIAVITFVSTFLGGLFALRFKDRLHLLLGFSAGAVLGVAFFDLLPESLKLGGYLFGFDRIFLIVAIGFFIYMICSRAFGHSHDDSDYDHRGRLGAGSLSLHSLLDGLSVGLAFHVSLAAGIVVAVGVLVHDFSDGINTVNMIVRSGGARRQAMRWLLADAVAPVVGIAIAQAIRIPGEQLGILLALFAGFFLYIGASDLLPESHHTHPTHWTTYTTVAGALVIYLAVHIAGL